MFQKDKYPDTKQNTGGKIKHQQCSTMTPNQQQNHLQKILRVEMW